MPESGKAMERVAVACADFCALPGRNRSLAYFVNGIIDEFTTNSVVDTGSLKSESFVAFPSKHLWLCLEK